MDRGSPVQIRPGERHGAKRPTSTNTINPLGDEMQPQGQPQYGPPPGQYQQQPQQYGPPQGQPQYGPPPGQYQQPAPVGYAPQPQVPQQRQPQAAQLGGMPTFAAPADAPASDRLKAGDVKGHLLIVVPVSHHVGYFPAKAETDKTKAQPAQDAVRVNVVDLDGRDQYGQPGKVYNGVMWGGVLLCPGLARQIGEVTLSVMVEGQARGANSAPLKLESRAEDGQAVTRATEFYMRRPDWQNQPSDSEPAAAAQPAPYQQAPAQQYQQQPYGQPNPGIPPQQYAPAQPVYDPAAQQQYPPQGQQFGQPQPPNPYQQGTQAPYDPAAQAMYANVVAQQQPNQYQG